MLCLFTLQSAGISANSSFCILTSFVFVCDCLLQVPGTDCVHCSSAVSSLYDILTRPEYDCDSDHPGG